MVSPIKYNAKVLIIRRKPDPEYERFLELEKRVGHNGRGPFLLYGMDLDISELRKIAEPKGLREVDIFKKRLENHLKKNRYDMVLTQGGLVIVDSIRKYHKGLVVTYGLVQGGDIRDCDAGISFWEIGNGDTLENFVGEVLWML